MTIKLILINKLFNPTFINTWKSIIFVELKHPKPILLSVDFFWYNAISVKLLET